MSYDWKALTIQEASELLFYTCVELFLSEEYPVFITNQNIRVLTQRLYGDYRQIHNTQEYKRAEKHVAYYKNTGLGYELF